MVAGTNGKIINRIHEINDFKIRNNGEKRSEYDTFSMKSSHNGNTFNIAYSLFTQLISQNVYSQ